MFAIVKTIGPGNVKSVALMATQDSANKVAAAEMAMDDAEAKGTNVVTNIGEIVETLAVHGVYLGKSYTVTVVEAE